MPHTREHAYDHMCRMCAGLLRLANGTALLQRGLVVAPKAGRLVIFSGGAENFHAPLAVQHGKRASLQMFFRCVC